MEWRLRRHDEEDPVHVQSIPENRKSKPVRYICWVQHWKENTDR